MKKLLLFTIGAIYSIHTIAQTTYTVSPSGTNSGTSWKTIKLAMAAAVSGDIIEVSAGTFTESAIVWSLKSLTIKGAGMNQTIIDGGALNNIFVLDGAYTSNNTITIQDMTIQNGKKTSSAGTAIRLKNTGNALTTLNLTNLKIINNNGSGGVYASGAILTVTGCYITGNTQTSDATSAGGGITVTGLAGFPLIVSIKNSTIANNSSIGSGGAIAAICAANGSTGVTNSLTIENSTIYGNTVVTTANRTGSGVNFRTVTTSQTTAPTNNLTINYCTIANNTNTTGTGTGADGVSIDNSGAYATNLVMNNSIVMGNSGSATNASQVGTSNSDPSTLGKIAVPTAITNSIFGIISGGIWVTTVNNNKLDAIIGDLAFDAALSTDAVPVLKIGTTSIAKDYVTNNQLTSITTDELGFTRDAKPDAGAYENPIFSAINTVNLDANVKLNGRTIRIQGISGTVTIYNTIGEIIASQKIIENGLITINKPDVYIVKINTGDKLYNCKLLVR